MVANELLMQFQADVLGVPVIRPTVAETTALGAAYAGRPRGRLLERARGPARELGRGQAVEPQMDAKQRRQGVPHWKKAVTKSFDWVEGDDR